ncbi:polysaccharide deacetylase family protein [Aggregatilinea lenta]|uniref:polysaccharide deacetylase family protein n=1 Tax=Aggregatilinea lenta TaxID=913108 RepID=UPI000E5AFCD9|nr:polysaccharide deacetylase family protein [Aggregatilinea lenta]
MASIRHLIRGTLRTAIYYTGLAQTLSGYKGAQARILVYHNIAPVEDDFMRGLDMTVSPDVFEDHARYLSENFRVVSLRQMLGELRSGNLPERTLVITFDDGYRDLYHYALPILREHNLPATIFLNTAVVGATDKLWPNKIAYVANKLGASRVAYQARRQWGKRLHLPYGANIPEIIWALNERVHPREIHDFVDALCRDHHLTLPDENSSRIYLDWAEITSMRSAGFEFGNHTHDHVNLALLSEQEQEEQIVKAKEIISQHLGLHEMPFAYPFGQEEHFTVVTRQIIKQSGHNSALEAIAGPVFAEDSPYALKRIDIRETPPSLFVTNVHGVSIKHALSSLKNRGNPTKSSARLTALVGTFGSLVTWLSCGI